MYLNCVFTVQYNTMFKLERFNNTSYNEESVRCYQLYYRIQVTEEFYYCDKYGISQIKN